MFYSPGSTYEFDVCQSYGENEEFFRIIVPEYGEVHLQKLKFQKEEPLPQRMRCRVKSFNNGYLILSHYVPDYVNRFYSICDSSSYEFTVVVAPAKNGDPYILEDSHGIRFNLPADNAFLSKGQKVLCRFDKITSNFFSIKMLGNQLMPPYYHPQAFFEKIGISGIKCDVLLKLLSVYLPEAKAELDACSPFWVMTAIRDSLPRLTDWFVTGDFHRHRLYISNLVKWLKRAGLYILEDSRYLRNIDILRRRDFQKSLTEIVDGFDPLTEAFEIVDTNGEDEFVESLTEKLSQSGYIYHPSARLSVLMLIMRRNPQLITNYLGGIFDAIMGWKLDTWTTEPFRSAFTDQFEIYIRNASKEIDLSPQAETGSDTDRIEKIITAIALQVLISGETDSPRTRLNRSRFYRYVSLQRPIKGELLLDKAFRTLMGAKLPLEYNYNNIRQPQALMTCATFLPQEKLPEIDIPRRFYYRNVEFTVTENTCMLRRTDDKSPGRTIPNGLMNWLEPQIYLDNFQALNGNQINSFEAHRRMWANIQTALFENRPAKVATSEKTKIEIDEQALIIISPEPVEKGDNPVWMVRIDDENFMAENGYICRDDIVAYKITSSNLERDREVITDAFLDENGQPRHFLARLTEVDSDGQLHFSLLDDVATQLSENMNDYDHYRAVIASSSPNGYSAIAETGYGVFLRSTGEQKYQNGDVITLKLNNKSNPNYLTGVIVGLDESGEFLNKTIGFANLLKSISVSVDIDDNESEQYLDDIDEKLSEQDMAELIELIRFKAISSSNLLEAFDYLHFARLLAIMIEDEQLADKLAVHAHLLLLHQFYAKNLRVDKEELEKHRSEVSGFPLLEMVFHRLELVSWLGDTERNSDLWATISNDRNHLETTLAQLVLSFNMLPPNISEDSIADNLKKRIAHTLGLNYEARQLKNYGNENLFTEFKSSLVYPARKNKEKADADPEAQQNVILKTIAAFMNSDGGTLFLGVNDKTHSETGLFEDFEYYKHYYPFDGKNTHKIANADNICNFLTNLVCNTWGNIVGGSVKIDTDPEASHDVIIINVEPRTTPVAFGGNYYVRRSGASKKLSEREITDFFEERRSIEKLRHDEIDKTISSTDAAVSGAEKTPCLQNTAAPVPSASESQEIQNQESGVATSTWRPNVLHSWDDGYVEPAGYLNFRSDCIERTDEDRMADYNDEYVMVLSYSNVEAEQGFLIMVYSNGRVLKVPMAELMQKDRDVPVKFNSSANLIFVSIAMPGSYLLCHLNDSKTNISRRVVPISEIENQHIASLPVPITTVSGLGGCQCCEIVPQSQVEAFSGSITQDLSSRQIGYLLRCTVGSEKSRQIFEEDCIKCHP